MLGAATLGFQCNPSGNGSCYLSGLPIRFNLKCQAGECTQPAGATAAGAGARRGRVTAGTAGAGGPPAGVFPKVAVIAAVPIVLLTLIGAALAAEVFAARRLFGAGMGGRGGEGGKGGEGGGGAKGGKQLEAFDKDEAALELAFAPAPAPHHHHQQHKRGAAGGALDAAVSVTAAAAATAAAHPISMPSDEPRPSAFCFEIASCSVPSGSVAPGGGGGGGGGSATSGALAGFSRLLPPRSGGGKASAPAAGGATAGGATAGGGGCSRSRRKLLLSNISGVVQEGEVLGVLGPSGSGKSTLLSILSGSTESIGAGAKVDGWVSLGGERRRRALRRATAFVPQRDVLLPALTVEECVRYSALLRLPRSLGAEQVQVRGGIAGLAWFGLVWGRAQQNGLFP